MPRLPRYVLPGQPQHVIQRGNNRCPIFIADDDFGYFRCWLQEACARHGCHIHAYVFMTNHIHLLLTPDAEESIAKAMQPVGRRYVQYFNAAYQRTGTLWEGRYKATLIDAESYLFACSRYIELNPVRAGMVDHPGGYRWSSYHVNALGKHDSLVQPHDRYLALDASAEGRQAVYRDLFRASIDVTTLNEIRQSTQKGWVLGNDRFKEEIEKLLQRRAQPLPRGGDRRSVEFKKQRV
ncbi:MAG: transposase [Gammaproteobacteria bacterium]|nr:transposase [Gammaproteobacteria bacterium]